MPTLPLYDAQKNINANVAAPGRDEASRSFQGDQKIIGTLQAIAQHWSDANDVMQYTEAKAKHSVAVADIEARAQADPDFKNSQKYYDELQKVRNDSLQGISNGEVAAKAGLEFDYDSKIAQIKIGGQFQQKQLDYNKSMVKTNLDALLRNKLSASTPSEAQQYELKIKDLLQSNVQTGTLGYDEARKMLTDSQETSVRYDVYEDNSTQEQDSAVLAELKDPNGKYSFLDPDIRLKMIQESQRRIFQNNQTFKREADMVRDENFNDVFTKLNERTLTLNDLDKQMAIPEEQGGIPKKQILDIRNTLQRNIKSDLQVIVENNDKAQDYLDFVDTYIDNETDRQKGREAIVQAYKDNILSPKEAAFLNKLKKETEDIGKIRSRENFQSNNLIPFKNAINAVNDFFTGKKNFTESEKALAIKQLLNGSADGADPQEAAKSVITDAVLKKNPNILNLSPEGQLVIDENGYVRIMNNKGEIKDVGKSTSKEKK